MLGLVGATNSGVVDGGVGPPGRNFCLKLFNFPNRSGKLTEWWEISRSLNGRGKSYIVGDLDTAVVYGAWEYRSGAWSYVSGRFVRGNARLGTAFSVVVNLGLNTVWLLHNHLRFHQDLNNHSPTFIYLQTHLYLAGR